MAGRVGQIERLALELARGQSHADAARSAGVSVRTCQRRLPDPSFRRRVSRLRSALVEQAAGRLADAGSSAVDTLKELLTDRSASIRLSASRAILEHVCKLREAGELSERVEELEAKLAQASGGRHR